MRQQCKYEDCDSKQLKTIKTPDTPHYAKRVCDECGRLQKWVANPNSNDNGSKRNTSKREVRREHGYDSLFCFWCARTKDELGRNETFEVDHIRELSDGGEDRVENCRILCTKCHKQRNHDKLYIKEHLQKFYNGDTNAK